MTLRLNGSTSGYTEIDAPAVAGSNTLVLPTGNGSADQALVTNGSGTLSWADRGRMTLATAQNSTSGTSIDFTGIPSWVKKITVMFNGVSTNGTSQPMIQIGTSGGIQTTGYSTNTCNITTGVNSTVNYTNGWQIFSSNAANVIGGALTLVQQDAATGTWVGTGLFSPSQPSVSMISGTKALSGTLDRVRITTVNGTDTFDAGSINILYEG